MLDVARLVDSWIEAQLQYNEKHCQILLSLSENTKTGPCATENIMEIFSPHLHPHLHASCSNSLPELFKLSQTLQLCHCYLVFCFDLCSSFTSILSSSRGRCLLSPKHSHQGRWSSLLSSDTSVHKAAAVHGWEMVLSKKERQRLNHSCFLLTSSVEGSLWD